MDLNERKIKILEAIINDYIATAEPIGSRTIAKKYNWGISSATIRNEMSDLEELGLILQPHASAGRVPSDKGYRLYVDKLMHYRELTQQEISFLHKLTENVMHIDGKAALEETMFLGLRMLDGVALTEQITDCYGNVIDELVRKNLLRVRGGRASLTDKGLDFANVVFTEFL